MKRPLGPAMALGPDHPWRSKIRLCQTSPNFTKRLLRQFGGHEIATVALKNASRPSMTFFSGKGRKLANFKKFDWKLANFKNYWIIRVKIKSDILFCGKNKVFCKVGKSGFQAKWRALSRSRPLFLQASSRVKCLFLAISRFTPICSEWAKSPFSRGQLSPSVMLFGA